MLPGAALPAPAVRARPKDVLRKPKPLTARELESIFARITFRVLKRAEAGPFGVFAIRKGRGRVFQLIGKKSSDYEVQLRLEKVLHHMIGTYDGAADLAAVWEDLCDFDRAPAR